MFEMSHWVRQLFVVYFCNVLLFNPVYLTQFHTIFRYYQPELFQASCLPCSPGLFNDRIGSAVCQDCAMGTFSRQLRSVVCLECKAGTGTTQEGSAFCNDCARGRYGSQSQPCKNCDHGTFTKDPGKNNRY